MPYIIKNKREILNPGIKEIFETYVSAKKLTNIILGLCKQYLKNPKENEPKTKLFMTVKYNSLCMGDYNYVITKLIHNYILQNSTEKKLFCYATINTSVGIIEVVKQELCNLGYNSTNLDFLEILGMLQCMELELYCAVVKNYEKQARSKNGSVSILDLDND
jgi:hypothetical protein